MKISASIYSDNKRSINEIVEIIDELEIDFFHVDCNDDEKVFEDIIEIKKQTSTPVDLHIISSTPEEYFELIENNKVDLCAFQFENFSTEILFPTFTKTKIGLAIMADTPIEVFEKYKNFCSFILLMTTTPGKSGGAFNTNTFQKIRRFKKQYPDKKIHVDGGVNNQVSFMLRDLGVYASVSGSYLMQHKNIGSALLKLKSEQASSNFLVKDFMLQYAELPILSVDNSDFKKSILMMEEYKLGFVFYTSNKNKLAGISSNADLRRAVLKNIDALDKIQLADMINKNPITINENKTIAEMISLVKSFSFPVLFLPVINDENEITGALTFNNLIKGES
jgi:pentose-5-phosphate-3-epimerase/CBS domain-containing protein